MKFEDQNIISGLKSGDEETYINLFRQYYAPLCAYAKKYVERNDIAEEVVSDTFYRIWKEREILHIHTSIKSYLFRAVVNNSLYYLRKQESETRIAEVLYREINDNREIHLTHQEKEEHLAAMESAYEQLREVIEHMPEQQKTALKLKRFEGKRNKEIADIMNIREKTVEMHLTKAMKFLRENFKIRWILCITLFVALFPWCIFLF